VKTVKLVLGEAIKRKENSESVFVEWYS